MGKVDVEKERMLPNLRLSYDTYHLMVTMMNMMMQHLICMMCLSFLHLLHNQSLL